MRAAQKMWHKMKNNFIKQLRIIISIQHIKRKVKPVN